MAKIAEAVAGNTDNLLCCTQCGVQTEAKCACGKGYSYVPASKAAALAVAAHPDWSNRRIAEAVGVAPATIDRLRSTASNEAVVVKRVGKDGKARKRPHKPESKLTTEAGLAILAGASGNDIDPSGSAARRKAEAARQIEIDSGKSEPSLAVRPFVPLQASAEFEHLEPTSITKLPGAPGKFNLALTQSLHAALKKLNCADADGALHALRLITRFLDTHGLEIGAIALHLAQPTKH
jgi:hypothetical protein